MMNGKSDESNRSGVTCRICLKGDGPMSSIFTGNGDNDTQAILATRITSIAQVKISPGDGLPASICESCHNLVEKFNDFRLLIEASDRALRSQLQELQKSQKKRPQSEEIENITANSNELFAINTILVPSSNGTEVWQICSVESEECEEPEVSNAAAGRTNLQDSKKEVKNELSRKITLIQNTQGKQPRFLTTMTNNVEKERVTSESEQLTRTETTEEEKNDEPESSPLPLNKHSCQLCLKPFKNLRMLKSHVKDHFLGGKERIQICELDKKTVRLSSRLKNSNRKPISEGTKKSPDKNREKHPVVCQSCERVFESEEKLLRARIENRKSTGNQRNVKNDKKSCRDCGREIIKSSNHEQVGHEDSSLTCKICNKHFRNAQSYKMHLKRHTLGCRYNCDECDKSYYSNSELARHKRLHTGKREFPCRLCEMSFFSKPELNRHTKYHNGEKKFKCTICSKSYYESGHLKIHLRVHTGEKPFPCSICKKAFTTKSKLIRHSKIHEKNTAT